MFGYNKGDKATVLPLVSPLYTIKSSLEKPILTVSFSDTAIARYLRKEEGKTEYENSFHYFDLRSQQVRHHGVL